MKNIGLCFSSEFVGDSPLGHIGVKFPVYLRLLDFCKDKGWNVFVLTRKNYLGGGVFNGVWEYKDGKFICWKKKTSIDLVYDRTGGIKFPPEDDSLRVVNTRQFKIFSWDKWNAYQDLKDFMPETFWVGEIDNIPKVLPKILTDLVVIKPFNGLKGIGIYIGSKNSYRDFSFPKKYKQYIAQEFIDTSSGIPGLVTGLHDLRVVIVNGEIVWSHIRTPQKGEYMANVARGGDLMDLDLDKIPKEVKIIVDAIAKDFYKRFDNPIYSLDFGMGTNGKPYIFEVNDQIGFPRWEMKYRDAFLKALISNFSRKL